MKTNSGSEEVRRLPRKLQIAVHVHSDDKLKDVALKIADVINALDDIRWDDIEAAISCAPPDAEKETADAIGFHMHGSDDEEEEEE